MVRLHAQASAWFAENGLIEEALKHALAGENLKAAAQLIVTHGFDLMNDEQWPRLERWLRMLTGNVIDEDPELLLLISWLHMIYARFAELMPCLNKAEALFSARAIAGPMQGHLLNLSPAAAGLICERTLRAHSKITSHFIRRSIPSRCVAKARNIQIFLRFRALPDGRLNA